MTILGNSLLIIATVIGIPTVLLLQFILGYKQVSSKIARVVPVVYGLLLTYFTLSAAANGQWTLNHSLFLGSQWLVSYFFYFIYSFGKSKSIEKVGELNADVEEMEKNRA
ncbi:hypothetical protein ACFQ5M_09700 [Agrilactobacillus yilanensis]|uniref:DUF2304 domain-containing protein n=1 Tax=Agrilactobacillus yilanensis TaxID=2485997 RepID=A0ABW4J7R4_9LACO|nr:hypothetical protein [Agrilactobacillus yilanensis]